MPEHINPTFQDITPATKTVPTMSNWYLNSNVFAVPQADVKWMMAQGWAVTNTYDDGLGNIYSNMNRVSLQNWNILQELLTDFTNAYNEGRDANDKRYEDIIRLWNEMLDKTQDDLDTAQADLNNSISLHMTTLDNLADDYDDLFDQLKDDVSDITVSLDADRTRVNERYDALLAKSRLDMQERGMYQPAVLSSVEGGIERERQAALAEVSQKEQLAMADIASRKNNVYANILGMKGGLIGEKMKLTNRKQDFLAYHLNERNKILMGLFGFVEKRNDSYPDLGSLAQLTASLAETGTATWQSM